MKIEQVGDEYIPVWVDVMVLGEYWKNNISYYVSNWTEEPKSHWFKYDSNGKRISFITGNMSLAQNDEMPFISFTSGLHRTRWIMSVNKKHIPVGIKEENYAYALRIGLAITRVTKNEAIIIPNNAGVLD